MATYEQLAQACTYHIEKVNDYSIYKQLRWSLDIGCTPEQKAQMIDIVQRSYARLQELKPTATETGDLRENVIVLFADITP